MPSQSAPPRHRAKPWVRRRRLLLLFVALFLLLPMAFLLASSHYSEKRYEAQLAAIRAAGFPVTVEELQNWTPAASAVSATDIQEPSTPLVDAPMEEAKDAVAIYLEVFDGIKQNEDDPGLPDIGKILDNLDKNEGITEAELAELRRFLAANENALKLLLDTLEMTAGRFPLDYSNVFEMELPHLAKMRAATRLLRAAAYAAALDNDPELACRAIMAGLAFNRALEQEPILISQLVRWGVNGILISALDDTLGRANYTDAQLAQLQRAYAAGHDPVALRNALVSERVFGVWLFDSLSQAFDFGDPLKGGTFPDAMSVLVQTANAVGWFNTDRVHFLDTMDRMIQASTLPYTEFSAIMRNASQQTGTRLILPNFNELLLPTLDRLPEAMACNEARLMQVSTACAVERYRLANGAPPDSLNALVPAYLTAVPVDPFDNQSMRYRREGGAYTLYSVGVDGVDGGGVAGENFREGDLVFRKR